MTERKRKWIAGSLIAAFLLLSAVVFWFVGQPLVKFASEPERFRQWVDARGIWGRMAFLGMAILQVFVAVIPGEPLEIAAGYAFGAVEGTILCLISMTVGGALIFRFVRRFGVKALEVFISREKIESLRILRNTKRVYAFTIAAFILPGTPKDVLSYGVGLTKIKFTHWLWITSVCRLPSIVTSTIGGGALGSGDILTAVIVFGATLVLSAAGLLIYRRISRDKETT